MNIRIVLRGCLFCRAEFFEGFAHGFFDDGIVLLLAIHIVDGYLVVPIAQEMFLQAVGFPHPAAQAVTVHGVFEQRLGCPDENLGGVVHRGQVRDAQGPNDKAFALGIQLLDAQLPAEFLVLGKVSIHFMGTFYGNVNYRVINR